MIVLLRMPSWFRRSLPFLCVEGMRFFPWNDELFEYTRRRAEGEVKRMIEGMLAKLQKDFGTDALNLGEFAWRRFPMRWNSRKWKEEFPTSR